MKIKARITMAKEIFNHYESGNNEKIIGSYKYGVYCHMDTKHGLDTDRIKGFEM